MNVVLINKYKMNNSIGNPVRREKQIFRKENEERYKSLTCKEKEVFELVVRGNSTKQISEILFIASNTVSTHRKRIKEKLELFSSSDWFKYAIAFEIPVF